MYHYSETFLSSLDTSNVEIANQLLNVFNEAFLGFENSNLDQNQLFIRFCHYDKQSVKLGVSVLFAVTPNLVKFYETNILEINEIDSLVSRIIRYCDLSYNERNSFQDDLRLTIEKYALKDFIKVIVKDYINKNSSIIENINYQIVVEPMDAQLYINDETVETINGVYNSSAKAGTTINVKIDKQGYNILEDSFIINTELTKKYTLEPIYIKAHFAIVPNDACINLYKVNDIESQPLTTLSIDQYQPSSLIDILPPDIDLSNLEEIELNKVDDMYCQDLRMYDKFILYTKKRLYKSNVYMFTALDNIHKVITLESYKVHVTINLDEQYKNNSHVSINDKSIDVFPYEMDCAIGEYLKIEAFTDDGMQYSNFVIINEADIKDGLVFNISFTKMYHLSVSLTQKAQLYINGEFVGDCFEGDFIEGSVVDIKVQLDGYVPINERLIITHDVDKIYTLDELIPRIPVVVSVVPDNALLTINGKEVLNPYISEVYENTTLNIRASCDNYYSYNEKFVITKDFNKNIVLEALPILNVTLEINCNVQDAQCYINDQIFTLPGSLVVPVGSRLKIEVFKDGYTSYKEDIVVNENQELNIELKPLENPNNCALSLYVDKVNALVMINGKQIDPISINNYTVSIPKDTIVDLQVTLPNYSPYYERFVMTGNIEKRVYLQKQPELEMYRLSVFVQNTGAILKINDIVESHPFVKDYRSNAPVNIKCYLDGYRTFEQNIIMTKNLIVPIVLDKLIEVNPFD